MMMKRAIVYKSTGSRYKIKTETGEMLDARVKGKMKIDKRISSTNPIAVGDAVQVEETDEDQMIVSVDDRSNYIIRVSPHNKHQMHIVAANLDLALVIACVAHPRTSYGFIDRFLMTAEAYHVPALIVVNKIDLLGPEDAHELDRMQAVYAKAGYEVLPMSALDAAAGAELSERLTGKTTLFSGHSGVGKSTLINALIPELALRTEKISDYSGKGQHTTTFAEMFDLPQGGSIIDTPGVKEFGIPHIEQNEAAQYFPEMRKLASQCRFHNCLHLNEPACAVKAALDLDVVPIERYKSYLDIHASLEKIW